MHGCVHSFIQFYENSLVQSGNDLTFTSRKGVAYSISPGWGEPKTLQHWPGKMINELANKVPTTLEYAQPQNAIKAWGFLCEQESEDLDVVSCFKLHLDPAFMDRRPDAPKLEDARKWFQDYLYCLHDHIRETFSNISPRWGSQKTEFIFSVPTTWKNPSMIAETERLVRRAGFGTDGPDHRTRIGLTEAEAAAVYASKPQYEVELENHMPSCIFQYLIMRFRRTMSSWSATLAVEPRYKAFD